MEVSLVYGEALELARGSVSRALMARELLAGLEALSELCPVLRLAVPGDRLMDLRPSRVPSPGAVCFFIGESYGEAWVYSLCSGSLSVGFRFWEFPRNHHCPSIDVGGCSSFVCEAPNTVESVLCHIACLAASEVVSGEVSDASS